MKLDRVAFIICAMIASSACGGAKAGPSAGQSTITADSLLAHIKDLAADSMQGRLPGTPGEEKTVAYLIAQFKAIGLEPGNPDGSWTQPVELLGFTPTPTLAITAGSKRLSYKYRDDFVAVTRHEQPHIDMPNSPLVFVGYGVTAPEYQWDDYKDVDVRGKTIVMLVNDPAVPDAADSTRLDSTVFRGKAMTYYGRWTYKYEEASRRGAAAAILVHQTGPAGYPWEVVAGSWGGENMDVKHADGNVGRIGVEAWITLDKAKELFKAAGQDFDRLAAVTRTREFRPVALEAKATWTLGNAVRAVHTRNVIGRLPGGDAKLKDEYVIFTAHWDHLGMGQPVDGDSIFNGALDNASGTSGLLELARAFKAGTPPKRSILFLAVTAEEQGLQGAKFYAQNPLYPLERTVADLNIDGVNQWGKTSDIVVIGKGNSTLEDILAKEAAKDGRTLSPDAEPEKGFYYRSDHFEFAKVGVPAMFLESGVSYIGKPPEYSKTKRDEYTEKDYHKPSDQVKSDWDLSGAVQDLQTLFRVGTRVANDPVWPAWKPGTEFKAIREKMLAGH